MIKNNNQIFSELLYVGDKCDKWNVKGRLGPLNLNNCNIIVLIFMEYK